MKRLLSLTLLASALLTANAQGTVQDYKNAFAIRGKYSNKMINGNVSARQRGNGNFWYSTFNGDKTVFYEMMEKFKTELNSHGRNVVSNVELEMLREWDMVAEVDIHADWAVSFKKKYADN